MSAIQTVLVLRRELFPGLVQLHGCVFAVAVGNVDRPRPTALLGRACENDVVNVARHGVGVVSVLRVTAAIAASLILF